MKYTSVSAPAARYDFFDDVAGLRECTASLHHSSGIENISL